MALPVRSVTIPYKLATDKLELHKEFSYNSVWKTDSKAMFVDVLSIAPITSIKEVYINDVNIEDEELSLSVFNLQTGEQPSPIWEGNFPYVERTTSISKQADTYDEDSLKDTSFIRTVSSVGVSGVRVNFTSPSFKQSDDQGRRKLAHAFFNIRLLNDEGVIISTVSSEDFPYYHAANPISIPLTLIVPDEYKETIWTYKVEMRVRGRRYGVPVTGGWTASTVTELYRDTQTYENIAYCSGSIVASEIGVQTPTRTYLVEGYKVQVPNYVAHSTQPDTWIFTGLWNEETSESHAWNTMAVLTNNVWGGGLDIDKINLISFLNFEKYCAELVDGQRRYSHSQYLIKSDNYFKIASQIVGLADGKLYEDSSGRIGVLIDKEVNERRVITSYDIVDEKVKRTTVPDTKRTNFVECEFDDKDNSYKSTIINVEDSLSIIKNGVISEKLSLEGCTSKAEAERIINKVLVTSQTASSSYVFTVGHSHEDIRIGEVISLYDRVFSRFNYCGKVKSATIDTITIDSRTPIDIDEINTPTLVINNPDGVPFEYPIISSTSSYIQISGTFDEVPEEFISFAVKGTNISPTEVRVTNLVDNGGEVEIQGVEYNHSLYSHIENGTTLEVPAIRGIPVLHDETLNGLSISKTATGLQGSWDEINSWTYSYYWRLLGKNGVQDQTIGSGSNLAGNTSTSLDIDLEEGTYTLSVTGFSSNGLESTGTQTVTLDLSVDNSGVFTSIPKVVDLQVVGGGALYSGRSFDLQWTQPLNTGNLSVLKYVIKISDFNNSLIKEVNASTLTASFSDFELSKVFGESRGRDYTTSVSVVDTNLFKSSETILNITNTTPIAPSIEIAITGDVLLGKTVGTEPVDLYPDSWIKDDGTIDCNGIVYCDEVITCGEVVTAVDTGSGVILTTTVPEDAVGSKLILWKSEFVGDSPNSSAITVYTDDLSNILVPDNYIVFDGSNYNYLVAWYDNFGDIELAYTQESFIANPDLAVPEAPELLGIVSIDDTTVKVDYEHDGTWLKNIQAYYRNVGQVDWIPYGNIFTVPAPDLETLWGYDAGEGLGYFFIEGLALSSQIDVKVTASNTSSAYSEDSNIVTGSTLLGFDTTELLQDISDLEDNLLIVANESLDQRELLIEGVVDVFWDFDRDKAILKETVERRNDSSTIVADITRLTSEFETEKSSSLARLTEVTALTTTSNEATALKIEELRVELNDETTERLAAISTVEQAIAGIDSVSTERITSLETSLNNETAEREANVITLEQAILDESTARASSLNTVNTAISDETSARQSAITTINDSLTDEIATRASQTNTLISSISDEVSIREASISGLNQTIVDETSARTTSFDQLSARIDNVDSGSVSQAELDIVSQAIADEESARVTQGTTLTAKIDTDIAVVDNSRKAAIGYCTISSVISGHGDKDSCQSAGGTWVESSLADAVNRVQVTDGVNTSTVGSHYQAYKSLEGDLLGKATFGVTTGGVFTGVTAIGGTDYSKLTFKADSFELQNSSGTPQFYWNSGSNTFVFAGTVSVGGTSLTALNTLNSNTTYSEISGSKPPINATANSTDAQLAATAASNANSAAKSAGTVGGWNINSSYIYSGGTNNSGNYAASGHTYFKSDGEIRTPQFALHSNGNAYFKGDISGASGTFSGLVSGGSINIGLDTFLVSPSGQVTINSTSSFSGLTVQKSTANGVALRVTGTSTSGGLAATATNTRAISGINSGSGQGVWAESSTGFGVQSVSHNSIAVYANGDSHDFYAAGSGTNYSPFTGSHEGLVLKEESEFIVGDILCDDSLINLHSVSNSIFTMELSSYNNQKCGRGVFVHRRNLSVDKVAALGVSFTYLEGSYDIIGFNALGEGAINVCGQGGNISKGDLIVTSDIKGKGMKQSDGIMRNITVAESRQNVTFDTPDQVKQIACIYHCG